MALLSATMYDELDAVPNTTSVSEAALALAQAYGNYIKTATIGGSPPIAAFIDSTMVPAMAASLTFTTNGTPSGGASKVVDGIDAFWGEAEDAPTSFIAGASAVAAPPNVGMAAALASAFSSNVTANRATALGTLADIFHTYSQGGVVTIASSPVTIL